MDNTIKILIVVIAIFSLLLGFGLGYAEGIGEGFYDGRNSFLEQPPSNCFCTPPPEKEPLEIEIGLGYFS